MICGPQHEWALDIAPNLQAPNANNANTHISLDSYSSFERHFGHMVP